MGNMNRTLFTEENMKKLKGNPNVHHVSETNITYTPAFKWRRCLLIKQFKHQRKSLLKQDSTLTSSAITSYVCNLSHVRRTSREQDTEKVGLAHGKKPLKVEEEVTETKNSKISTTGSESDYKVQDGCRKKMLYLVTLNVTRKWTGRVQTGTNAPAALRFLSGPDRPALALRPISPPGDSYM
ncbi:hypothetical protein [Cohnella sp. GbtcB17]|uniref:hypothetical protein n=1 Tax=Cohnella sp. GbtcB17 TaxID=2824762 RepID=UPI001C2F60D7|nr:hypothetical protein [Cohnella sp. GbtcB17]